MYQLSAVDSLENEKGRVVPLVQLHSIYHSCIYSYVNVMDLPYWRKNSRKNPE